MQNGDKALPRKLFVAKPSHHFAYLCLDVLETHFCMESISERLC